LTVTDIDNKIYDSRRTEYIDITQIYRYNTDLVRIVNNAKELAYLQRAFKDKKNANNLKIRLNLNLYNIIAIIWYNIFM
jgi:hypothetical protein